MAAYLTTTEAASRLGISRQRLAVLIRDGRIGSVRFGRVHQVRASDLAKVTKLKPGRKGKAT